MTLEPGPWPLTLRSQESLRSELEELAVRLSARDGKPVNMTDAARRAMARGITELNADLVVTK